MFTGLLREKRQWNNLLSEMIFLKEHLKKNGCVEALTICPVPVLCSLNAKSNNDKRPLLSGKRLILFLVWVEELSDMVQDTPFP